MTLIEHYSQLFHRRYVYPTDENKDQEFFVKMNKHFDELEEIEKKLETKKQEIKDYLETVDWNFGEPDYEEEIDYEQSLEEVKIDGKKLKFGKKVGMPSKYDFFNAYEYDDTQLAKMEKKMEEKKWYVTHYQIDEGWMELEVDEEFDQSKLKFDGETMRYGEEYLSDEGGTKPNSDIDITCEYNNEETGTYFSHSWY